MSRRMPRRVPTGTETARIDAKRPRFLAKLRACVADRLVEHRVTVGDSDRGDSAPADAEPSTAYVGIGANLGDAAATVRQAIVDIAAIPHCRLLAASPLYRTAPVDSCGPDYINAVVAVSTRCAPLDLLHALQALEQAAHRQRPYRNAPRTLDLDLLTYGDRVIETPALQLPHPRMGERAFVLVPLQAVAPERVSARLLRGVAGQAIERLDEPDGPSNTAPS